MESEGKIHHRPISEPCVRLVKIETHSEKTRLFLNKGAYEVLGRPDFVQIFFSKNSQEKFKLVPCQSHALNARRVRNVKGKFSMGGAPNMLKRHMKFGYYLHTGDGVFGWRWS